jgi:hypothetical protein
MPLGYGGYHQVGPIDMVLSLPGQLGVYLECPDKVGVGGG